MVHRDGAEDLGEIFAEPDASQELFSLPEATAFLHPPRVRRHFLDRFDIGREPGQPVNGVLFGLDLVGAELPILAHPLAHRGQRAIQDALNGEMGMASEVL